METISPPTIETREHRHLLTVPPSKLPPQISPQEIRTSLKASTIDGIFAAIFSSITSGVLLTNFLLHLGASSVEIGMLSSIPMVVNLLQPLGAYFADRTTSRHNYCLYIFGVSRLLWLILVVGIGWVCWSGANLHQLVSWTLSMILVTHILNALGSSCWVSWMAALVPHRLRGRYFGFRNSAISLTTLLSVPIFGVAVSAWPNSSVQGYGIVLLLGVVTGLISLGCQFFMADVNPLQPRDAASYRSKAKAAESLNVVDESSRIQPSIFQDTNFLKFLLYFGLWTFAVNLSAPFFNLYLLDNLHLNLSWVTTYTSLTAGANLVMLVLWGKMADRIGNRPLLLFVGILAAITPIFWLGAGADSLSRWIWLPLIHIFSGGTWAAIDLCSNNIQMEVAPVEHPSKYFAIAAAISGVCGAFGTTTGGFLAQLSVIGGLPGLFALSVLVRLIALFPLVFVREPRSQSVLKILRNFLPFKPQLTPVPAVGVGDSSK
ncbi:MFS transporter [Gloeocapsopsis dulcis]|uniref:MFS transporter n=1 Tax=Gloeocapsopsis dulcis AAB1 = 1H9 TaxID=1433147 RepID=A0A6N8FVY4_9CHRO|nr:MFS transporter [Gloeocapsopsis dulcis]MUL36475.1 MFS transporter [Gloeocapsopsis dulcis AAB1 = 1H9]WNN87763.1 MFS transporter [Gloeocapsopsis dulcis]